MQKSAFITGVVFTLCALAASAWFNHESSIDPAKADADSLDALIELAPSRSEPTSASGKHESGDFGDHRQAGASAIVEKRIATLQWNSDQEQESRRYAEYDAKIREDSVAPPSWFYSDRNVYVEVAARDPGAVITSVHCGDDVCRAEIAHVSEEARDRFGAATLTGVSLTTRDPKEPNSANASSERQWAGSSGVFTETGGEETASLTVFRYPEDESNKTYMYIVKTEPVHERAAELMSGLAR